MVTPDAGASAAVSRRDRLRADLEAARDEYHQVLATISDEQWARLSGNPKWTVGTVLAHIVLGLNTVPLRLRAARQGKRRMRMPPGAFNIINTQLSRRFGRQNDRTTIGAAFDEKYAAVLALLEGVDDNEWERTSYVYIQRWTVEEVFASQAAHIRGHLAEVKAALSH